MGTVHVVATPIGNLEDISLRALRVLAEADLILAEDTRRTRILLDRHQIAAKPLSLHVRNEGTRIRQVLERLEADARVALVSDAGTPLVSDPGARLIAAAIGAGHEIDAVPGASAVLAALCVSGLPAKPFVFLGFPPRRSGERRKLFDRYRERCETLVLFESPHRVAATLRDLSQVLGPRRGCLARELTKLHQEIVRAPLPELAERFAGGARGEVTLVVEGIRDAPRPVQVGPEQVDGEIRALVDAGHSPRQIAAALAEKTGLPKRELYARAVALRENS